MPQEEHSPRPEICVTVPRSKTPRRQRRIGQQVLCRITMFHIDPPIWRLVRVPDAFTLHQLHRVLQIVFSRLDYHLYMFEVGDRSFEAPDPEAEGEDSTSIRGDLELHPGSRFTYTYDFGDMWRHEVQVEDMLPMPSPNGSDWSPRLVDGGRAAPPEDAGGPLGYERLVAVLGDPGHPEHAETRAWAGLTYDPERFDPWAVDHALALAVGWGAI